MANFVTHKDNISVNLDLVRTVLGCFDDDRGTITFVFEAERDEKTRWSFETLEEKQEVVAALGIREI